jgi:hypothetical protein
MADDDKQNDSGSDPWAGIESSSTPDLSEGLGFSFDEPAESSADEANPFAGLEADSSATSPAAEPAAVGEDDVGDWLKEEAAESVAPLSVFSPDEPAMSDDDVAAMLEGDGSAAGIPDVTAAAPAEESADGPSEPEPAFPFSTDDVQADDAEPIVAAPMEAEEELSWGAVGQADAEAGDAEGAGDDAAPAGGDFDFMGGGTEAVEDAPLAFAAEDPAAGGEDLFSAGVGDAAAVGGVAVGAAAGAAAAAAKAKPAVKRPAAKPAKKSGLGQMVGVVLGGVMAIPITLAILIWGLQKDPFKIAKYVPEDYKFILPQKLQGKKQVAARGPDLTQAASLDTLPPGDGAQPTASGDGEPAAPADGSAPDAAAGGEKPMKQPGLDDLAASVSPDPTAGETPKPAAPTEPPPATEPPPPPEPEPLDLSGLDAAVTEATTAMEAVAAADAGDKKARMRLLAGWYKSLAKVAEELAMLERVAADSGRPLEAPPEQFVKLHAAIAAEPSMLEELGTWGRNWIRFSKRGSAGIVLPVTFDSAARLGPFWSAKVLIDDGTGKTEEIALVSRAEPAALAGDKLVVTGLLLDGDVIWASDWRKPGAEEPAADKPAASPLDNESF